MELWNEINAKKTIIVKYAIYLVAKRKPEKLHACWDLSRELCDTTMQCSACIFVISSSSFLVMCHFHISHNAPYLPLNILHKHCF